MTTFTITVRDLRDLLKPLYPLAGKDDMLPMLSTVHLTSTAGELRGATTDRFRMGMTRFRHETIPAGVDVLMRTADLRRIQALWRSTRHTNPILEFKVGRESSQGKLVTVTQVDRGGDRHHLMVSASLSFWSQVGDYPAITKLIAATREQVASPEPVGLNPVYLSDFRHAITHPNEPVVLRVMADASDPTKGKPVVVTCGDHFVGLLMPVKMEPGSLVDLLDTWGTP